MADPEQGITSIAVASLFVTAEYSGYKEVNEEDLDRWFLPVCEKSEIVRHAVVDLANTNTAEKDFTWTTCAVREVRGFLTRKGRYAAWADEQQKLTTAVLTECNLPAMLPTDRNFIFAVKTPEQILNDFFWNARNEVEGRHPSRAALTLPSQVLKPLFESADGKKRLAGFIRDYAGKFTDAELLRWIQDFELITEEGIRPLVKRCKSSTDFEVATLAADIDK